MNAEELITAIKTDYIDAIRDADLSINDFNQDVMKALIDKNDESLTNLVLSEKLKMSGKDIDNYPVNNQKPLAYAMSRMERGKYSPALNAATSLIDQGADTDLGQNVNLNQITSGGGALDGSSPLAYFSSKLNLSGIKMCLDNGADPNFTTKTGVPLQIAVMAMSMERDIPVEQTEAAKVISVLIAEGASLEKESEVVIQKNEKPAFQKLQDEMSKLNSDIQKLNKIKTREQDPEKTRKIQEDIAEKTKLLAQKRNDLLDPDKAEKHYDIVTKKTTVGAQIEASLKKQDDKRGLILYEMAKNLESSIAGINGQLLAVQNSKQTIDLNKSTSRQHKDFTAHRHVAKAASQTAQNKVDVINKILATVKQGLNQIQSKIQEQSERGLDQEGALAEDLQQKNLQSTKNSEIYVNLMQKLGTNLGLKIDQINAEAEQAKKGRDERSTRTRVKKALSGKKLKPLKTKLRKNSAKSAKSKLMQSDLSKKKSPKKSPPPVPAHLLRKNQKTLKIVQKIMNKGAEMSTKIIIKAQEIGKRLRENNLLTQDPGTTAKTSTKSVTTQKNRNMDR